MNNTNFAIEELNININNEISGQFIYGTNNSMLTDTSNILNFTVSKSFMNTLFLFYCDESISKNNLSDLSQLSNTTLYFALNLEQWNPKLKTDKSDRKVVLNNYLIDLFGEDIASEISNTNIFWRNFK